MSTRPKTGKLTENALELPRMFYVIMHNDDYTTMDFVVKVLMLVFNKAATDAGSIMMEIHNNGLAVVGAYVLDIAASKKLKAERLAEEEGFPLKLSIKEA